MNRVAHLLTLKRLTLAALVVAIACAVALLFFFAPESYAFYPRCMFHVVTGLDCPGCGALRATHKLLHGDVAAAFALNPLYVLLLPLLGWFLAGCGLKEATGRALPNPRRR